MCVTEKKIYLQAYILGRGLVLEFVSCTVSNLKRKSDKTTPNLMVVNPCPIRRGFFTHAFTDQTG